MAPTRRVAPKNEDVLHELVSIRNTIQLAQQSLSRLERHVTKKSIVTPAVHTAPRRTLADRLVNSTVQTTTPRRVLAERIFNAEVPVRICWYHRQFGQAANPLNCPGPEECSFIPPRPIAMKKTTRTKVAGGSVDVVISGQTKGPERTIAPGQSIPSVPVDHSIDKSVSSMDWSAQVDQEKENERHQAIKKRQIELKRRQQEELEKALLDVSD